MHATHRVNVIFSHVFVDGVKGYDMRVIGKAKKKNARKSVLFSTFATFSVVSRVGYCDASDVVFYAKGEVWTNGRGEYVG